ncbi:MAG: hypothetical protein M0R32_02645 [Candidatus Cloacimonetes bacterium]|jgi:hypothetical protein|nr:hypothetical protein [Candidatus Cloacimonadota bacterium]
MNPKIIESKAKSLAIVMGEMPSNNYRIYVEPEVAARAFQIIGDGIESDFVNALNQIVPADWNGALSHRIGVGVEYTRVIYLQVAKAYFPENFDEAGFVTSLDKLALEFKCDECDVIRNDASALHMRFWWD